ncbi:MAG: hypothetical protein ACRD19_12875 [Terriglobia bacterium]
MIWHVIYEGPDGQVQSRAARSRDLAIQMACEFLQQSYEVRRVIGPQGSVIERAELDGCHFSQSAAAACQSGLQRPARPIPAIMAGFPAGELRRAAADSDKLAAAAAHFDSDCRGL